MQLRPTRRPPGRFAKTAPGGVPRGRHCITPAHLYVYPGRYTSHPIEVRCFFTGLVGAGYRYESPFRPPATSARPTRSSNPSRQTLGLLRPCIPRQVTGVAL